MLYACQILQSPGLRVKKKHLGSVQCHLLSFYPAWFIGMSLQEWIVIIPNTLGNMIPYKNHYQPTGVSSTSLLGDSSSVSCIPF